jgi:hypothetical protein
MTPAETRGVNAGQMAEGGVLFFNESGVVF